MITIRKSSDRGHADHGWLDSRHTFSFADYYDPREMGWGSLRVINEDKVQPGLGFGTHGHRDMEIISYVLAGELQHKDNMGNGAVIRPGDVQRMSAGTGVLHSEFNPSPNAPVHFLQIWIEPAASGQAPGYEQKAFAAEEKRGRLRLVASQDGREGSVTVHQDADLYASLLGPGEGVSQPIAPGRQAYLHLIRGEVRINGIALAGGDGAKIEGETELSILADADSELLLFDLG
ncbi:MAG: pirin family protein [Rhodocyclaceae bacterium]|nr:MAG: pirin family protein [Rhodocyclaceae bacterium]